MTNARAPLIDQSSADSLDLEAKAQTQAKPPEQSEQLADSICLKQRPQDLRRTNSVSRNSSCTSSDSGNHNLLSHRQSLSSQGQRLMCRCGSNPSLTSSSSASQVDQTAGADQEPNMMMTINKAATLDSSSCQRNSSLEQHQANCFFAKIRPRRASSKLQPSPSSASSHSNSSSLFRDDGFEDDLISTGSEHLSTSTYNHHHRLSFQGPRSSQHNRGCANYAHLHPNHHRPHHHHRLSQNSSVRTGEEEDDYQSCEDGFSRSQTTASTASNIDDCALSTTSSSLIQQDQQHLLGRISLATAKQQYRRSLLLEHQQQQQFLHSQHQIGQSKIQSLLQTNASPSTIPDCGSLSPCQSANTSVSSANNIAPNKTKCDNRTVNIIGHMPTRSPSYWDSNLSITQRVVTEIIETERAYVDDLEQIVTGYICFLRNVLKQQQQLKNSKTRDQLPSSADPSVDQEIEDDNDGSASMANRNMNEEDFKSMLAFDDDTTSAINDNDIEDFDVVDLNELALLNEGDLNQTQGDISSGKSKSLRKLSINQEISMKQHQQIQREINNRNRASDGAIMTANHIKKLFSNLEDIYKFNKNLLFCLEECYLNPSSVAECFVENASGFEVYTHYCTMYPQVVSTLTELMANQTSAQLLKERQNELHQSLPLGAYLLKPVQRILKYHILFQSLIKHTAGDDSVNEKDRQLIGEAFSVMTNIACHINSMKKRHEHAIRVQEVQGLLSGWDGPDLTTLGELILEESFKLYNRPKSARHLFLFDNVLLITKKKRDGSLCYKGHIECSNLMLIENIENQPLVFNTVPFDCPKALCAFQAKNLDKKREWCLQIKEVIIKSFEVKIPFHVRDILMSLTNTTTTTGLNNKASSDIHNKPIKTPNYLEKKRGKQDKKR